MIFFNKSETSRIITWTSEIYGLCGIDDKKCIYVVSRAGVQD